MLKYLTAAATGAVVPVTPIAKANWEGWLERRDEWLKRWVSVTGFTAEAGKWSLVPAPDGRLERVLFGLADPDTIWDWSALPGQLPEGTYSLDADDAGLAHRAALGWAFGTYGFERYRKKEGTTATLVWPDRCDREAIERSATATFLVRDLINTPASDMGPAELAEAAKRVAEEHGATFRVMVGDDLLAENYPSVHAVGQASARAPRLIDLCWGDESAPKVTLVGKGVCFDSGGLDLKQSPYMKLMKKDMGGAAHVLGLATMILSARLPVRLRVLIPAVENSVSGSALRPLDVISTRKGLTVEVGNTDAEGRLILADALSEAASERPELIVDFATLTGAARIALGTELPALFANHDGLAEALLRHGDAETDPLWRMPLWKPYRKQIDSKVANLNNISASPYAGAIIGGLFLAEFVDTVPWIHIDLMAWNVESRPGRPEGGEAQGMRAVYALLSERFGGAGN